MGNHKSRINKNVNRVSREKTITLHEKAIADSQKNNASQPLREAGLRKWSGEGREGRESSNRVLPRHHHPAPAFLLKAGLSQVVGSPRST